jgi:CheY-like chemotaxis protein
MTERVELAITSAPREVLFDQCGVSLVLFDASSPYPALAHNRSYQELWAEPFRTQGVVGRPLQDYVPGLEASGILAVFADVVRTRQPRNLPSFPFDDPERHRTWWTWHLAPVIQDGRVTALAGMAMDITREEEARRDDPFFAMLGHELRNPLAPILNAVHLIRIAGQNPALVESACAIVERQVAHMVLLVDDLLGTPPGARGDSRLPAAATRFPAAAPRQQAPLRPRRILIVEDLLDAAITLEILLEMLGHTVEVAHDGRSGLDKARSFAPDIILCDIGLPGDLDGYQVARTLRATAGLEHIHLIALTGFGAPEDLEQARRAGFEAHLTKPVDPAALGPFIGNIPGPGISIAS